MAEAFHRDRRGRIAARTEPIERVMLGQLLDELGQLLGADNMVDPDLLDPLARELGLEDLATAVVAEPVDDVTRRLLPDAYAGDSVASTEFRRFTDTSLRTGKIRDIEQMQAGLVAADADKAGRVSLTLEEAGGWARAINDLRLALGVKLAVSADYYPDPAALRPDDPQAVPATLYDFLTWWQDSLIRALLPEVGE